MRISLVEGNQNFNGNVILVNKISAAQKNLLNIHMPNLRRMMSDKPYDLYVKQSNSGKTILLSTDKDCKEGFGVRRNRQNFERVAQLEIKRKDELLEKEQQEKLEIARLYLEAKYHNDYFSLLNLLNNIF